jgi:hypothetical protein
VTQAASLCTSPHEIITVLQLRLNSTAELYSTTHALLAEVFMGKVVRANFLMKTVRAHAAAAGSARDVHGMMMCVRAKMCVCVRTLQLSVVNTRCHQVAHLECVESGAIAADWREAQKQ